jgi:hypothetical protein
MSSVAAELVVEVRGRSVGVEELLQRAQVQLQQTDAAATRTAATFSGTLPSAQQRSATTALQLSQAYARLAVAQGDSERAASILNAGLAANTGASERAIVGVQAQVARLQSGTTAATQFGDAMKSSLLGVIGPAAAAGAAFSALSKTIVSFAEAFKFKAELDATTASIRAQLTGVRDSNQVFSEGAQFAERYKLTQQETTEAIAASIGVMRTSKASVEDILSVLARLQVLSPEQSLQEAALAVKALASGDTQSLVARFEVSRDTATQMKNEIQKGGDAVQVLNKFLNDTGIGMDALASKTTGAAGKMKDLAKAQEDLKLAQADFAQGPGIALLNAQVTLTQGATRGLSGDLSALSQRLRNTADGSSLLGGVLRGVAIGFDAMTVSAMSAAEQEQLHASIVAQSTTIQQDAARVDQLREERMVALTAATADSGAQSQIDAQNKAEQTAQTELLVAQADAAVDAFLRLNPNMTASSAASAAAASGLSPLIARLIEAALRARDATNELARFNALQGVKAFAAPAAGEAEGEVRGFARGVRTDELKKQAAAAAAAAQAERDYQKQVGNFGPALARANRELELLPKGSEAAWNKMIEIERLKQQQATAARRGGTKAAGAAHLSDQQRLNNQLLTGQEKYEDQVEAALRQHQQKQLDIERDFQKKSLAQQRENDAAKIESRASFYKSLNVDNRQLSQQVREQLAGAYEAAFAKAQELAQSGNAQQANAYLKLKQQQLAAETQFQRDLAEAQKAKDAAQVKALTEARELERQAEAEREKQLLEGGDQNVNARQEALTDEQHRFEKQQGEIGDAADAAAQRKVDAAVRSGKAIDEENLKLQQQEQIINRIGSSGGTPPATSAGGAAAPAVPTAGQAAAPGSITDLPGIADALRGMADQITQALAAVGGDIVRAEQGTTRAVASLSRERLVQ